MVYAANKMLTESARKMFDFDPNDTLAQAVGWQSMSEHLGLRGFMAGVFRSVGTGSVGSFSINAATSSTGAGSTVVVSHALGAAPDAVGDQVYLEATAEQIQAALAAATHVSAVVALVTATDECVVLQERKSKALSSGQTADIIA